VAPAAGSTAPLEVTSFVGRRSELADVKRLLVEHRLVTLSGAGGVGKTRIATRVTTDLHRRFADGTAWVGLADLRDPDLVAQAVEDQLVIADRVGRDPRTVLINHLRDRSMLIVLDNAEHVREECAQLVDELMRVSPGLRVLVTSRQALNISGEHLFAVNPLPVPDEAQDGDPGAGVVYPALALFQDRAQAALGAFTITEENQRAVAAVCRKLDGIPLAIELATVRLRVLTVEELAERLEARLEALGPRSSTSTRHATLQAAIDWSHELCTPAEQLLWARAAVFAGGFTVEAAESCCGDDELAAADVLDTIAGLVDKSILTRVDVSGGKRRFKMLEPLREHGLARLRERGELESAQERHVAWCTSLLHEACLQWFGPTQERWCLTLQAEKFNIRAAAEHCVSRPELEDIALHMLGDPWFLWVALFLDEGRHWLDRALGMSSRTSPARAKALATAGYVAALQGDAEGAERFLTECLGTGVEVAGLGTIAYGTHMVGLCEMFRDPASSLPLFQQALTHYAGAEDVYDDYVVGLRVQLGLALMFMNDLGAAAEQFAICRDLCTVTGERWLLSYAMFGEAFVAFFDRRLDDALELGRRAVEIKSFFGDSLGLAVSLDLIAWTTAARGDLEEAAVLLGGASRIWDSVGPRLFGSPHWLAPLHIATDECVKSLGETRYRQAFARGEALPRVAALSLATGQTVVPPVPVHESLSLALTRREREIAELVADGLSNKAISQRLVIAQRTAECHVENILTKFGFHSRTQIAAWVAEQRALT
jgi:non-specific serine/threonine protein kinase